MCVKTPVDKKQCKNPSFGTQLPEIRVKLVPQTWSRLRNQMIRPTRYRYLLLMVLWAVCVPVFTQDNDNPQPDRWRDLVLDQSTPEDALKVLGKPSRRIESVAKASGDRLLNLEWKPTESS